MNNQAFYKRADEIKAELDKNPEWRKSLAKIMNLSELPPDSESVDTFLFKVAIREKQNGAKFDNEELFEAVVENLPQSFQDSADNPSWQGYADNHKVDKVKRNWRK